MASVTDSDKTTGERDGRERRREFNQVFRDHYSRLVQSLVLVSFDRESAADAAQEAFLKLFIKWDKVTRYENVPAWLYRVALNCLRDQRRATARLRRLLPRLAGASPSAAGVSPFELSGEVLSALRSLSRQQRMAVSLRYVADLSSAETAQAMGISEGALSSHLHRAREALSTVLEADQ